jgi:hypothetical protein
MTTEAVLAFALVAIYLFDSTHFLMIGEAVVGTRAGALARLSFGSGFELGGRRPYLPNPLTPFWPELRVEWGAPGEATVRPEQVALEMTQHLGAARRIGWIATACAVLIVVVAPVSLAIGAERVFVASAVMCFALAGVAGVFVFIQRRELGLTVSESCSAVAVALVCLPCSANLARAVMTRRRWVLAAADFPRLGFTAAQVPSIQRDVREALDRAQRFLGEDSAEYRALTEQLRVLGEPYERN